jgi:hypothetical protein
MPFLLFFSHYFDSYAPDLLGIYENAVDVDEAKRTQLPRSWKGEFYMIEVQYGTFIENGYYRHPLSELQMEQERKAKKSQ